MNTHQRVVTICLLVLAAVVATDSMGGFSGTSVFIPSVGRRPGVGGSQWYTALWIHNPSSSTANVSIRFLERDRPNPSPVTVNDSIPPGQTRRYEDLLGDAFHLDKWGALQVNSNVAVLVTCRMFNMPPGGSGDDTQGQDYAAVPASFAIGVGQSTQLVGVYQTNPRDNSEFRYSFGFVETTGNPATVRVQAMDEYGTVIATKDYPQLGAYEPRYYPIEDLVAAVDAKNLKLEVQVIAGAGKIVAVGSGVANRSNDGTTFEMAFRNDLLTAGTSGLTAVSHDSSLTGDGTSGAPLSVNAGSITKNKLSAVGGANGQVLVTDGFNLFWQNPSGGGGSGFSLPYSGATNGAVTAFRVEHASTQGTAVAVYGQIDSNTGAGVWGTSIASTGTPFGVVGAVESPDGVGVSGVNNATYGNATGIFGSSKAPAGVGILGYSSGTTGDAVGVYGESASSSGAGVYGTNDATTGSAIGVWAYTDSPTGFGVYGAAGSTYGLNVGVYGDTSSSQGYAGYFHGNARVTGYLYKSGGGFQIDDPLDPAHKYLNHAFVESPEMKNVYDGVAVLDGAGEATVQLPDWFEVLNESFRYQLTCVGGYAPVFIAAEVSGNSFRIGGGRPGLKVSWQVTGVRKDPWAMAHRLPIEQDKPAGETGTYLYPAGFGQPATKELHPAPAAKPHRNVAPLLNAPAPTK